MSASILQRKAAFATVIGAGSVAVTLDNPVSVGSNLVIACAIIQSDGSGSGAPTISVVDDLTNGYSPTVYTSSGAGLFANTYQGAVVPQAGARTYTLSYTPPAGQSAYKFLAAICVYELVGVSNLATNESASQSLSGLHKISDLSAAISGLSGGTYGNLLVSIFGSIFSSNLTDANAVAAGSAWTLDARDAISGTFSPMAIVFESQFVGPAGNPAATYSGSGNSTELDGTILVAAYSLTSAISGGGGGAAPSGQLPFLGSVTEITSEPGGPDNFIGTLTIVSNAPAGALNPYLGRIKSGTPSGGQSNPALGQVVILTQAPAGDTAAGDTNPFLGTVQKA